MFSMSTNHIFLFRAGFENLLFVYLGLMIWTDYLTCLHYCRALSFLYPYGATLNVMKPSTALLSTGSVSFPLNRPVCALSENRVSIWAHSIPNPCQIHFRFFFLSFMPYCKRSLCFKCLIFHRVWNSKLCSMREY